MEEKHLERLVEVEQRAKSNTHRIDKLEGLVKDIHELTSSIKEIAVEMRAMREDVSNIDSRVNVLEEKPAKRWESLIGTIIACVATAIAGFLLAKFGL